jgi:hypothetical protein
LSQSTHDPSTHFVAKCREKVWGPCCRGGRGHL